MKNISLDLSGKINKTSVSILRERDRIAMDIVQSDSYRNHSYERIIKFFNVLMKGLAEKAYGKPDFAED